VDLSILQRPRRIRRSENLRRLVRETRLHTEDLIWPLFVHAVDTDHPVESMPGVSRRSLDSLLVACEEAHQLGIPAVAIFPCIEGSLKNTKGTYAHKDSNILYRAVREIKKRFPELLVIADVALDPYTSHGHDGILSEDGDSVENDTTVEALCRLAVQEAAAGADIVAPSDMMDGRVGEIRRALDAAGFHETAIMSYAAKYSSAYYGPFRDAVGSQIGKDAISKATYQMDPANAREAIREVLLDGGDDGQVPAARGLLEQRAPARERWRRSRAGGGDAALEGQKSSSKIGNAPPWPPAPAPTPAPKLANSSAHSPGRRSAAIMMRGPGSTRPAVV